MRFPSIPCLRFWIRPTAVLWRIIFVVIDAIKSHSLRTQAHVRKEIAEGIAPSVTNSNSSSSVQMISNIGRNEASTLHILPSAIFQASSQSVRRFPAESRFPFQTTATFRVLFSQTVRPNDGYLPTIATTDPLHSLSFIWPSFEHCQFSETPPFQFQYCHRCNCNGMDMKGQDG
jgi:hypothetical protein